MFSICSIGIRQLFIHQDLIYIYLLKVHKLDLSPCLFKLTDVLLLIFHPMSRLMTLSCIRFSCYPFTRQVSMTVIQCREVKGSGWEGRLTCIIG